MNELLSTYEKMQDAISMKVKIGHGEILKVIMSDMREKRKHLKDTNQIESMKHFDFVLKYYFGEEDFRKYVIEWADID